MVKSKKTLSTKEIILYTIYLLSFVGVLIFLLWKCKYGFGNRDESFYLTIPYRMCQGDGLFINEWHLSQLSSILLYPFVYVYMLIAKTTTGMILTFRYIYTVVQSLASLLIFFRLRKINPLGAIISSLCFFIYAPFGIMAMSYNSLGVMCLTLSCVLFVTSNKSPLAFLFSGIFLACAVLCCPYLASLYVLFILAVVINLIKNRKKEEHQFLNLKSLISVTIGIALIFIIFLVFILSHTSIGNFFKVIPNILDDPEHNRLKFNTILNIYFKRVAHITEVSKYCYLALIIIILVELVDKKRQKHGPIYLILGSIATILYMYEGTFSHEHITFIMLPVNFLGIIVLLCSYKDKNILNLFYYVWIPGFIYSLCIHFSSNEMEYVICSAFTVSLCASITMICIKIISIIKNNNSSIIKSISMIILCIVLICQISGEIYLRYNAVFWDSGMEKLTQEFEDGLDKGIIASEGQYQKFNQNTENLQNMMENHKDAKNLLVFSKDTYDYLICENLYNASYSAWLATVSYNTIYKLQKYYNLNPDKIPDLVYVEEDNFDYLDDIQDLCNLTFRKVYDNYAILYK